MQVRLFTALASTLLAPFLLGACAGLSPGWGISFEPPVTASDYAGEPGVIIADTGLDVDQVLIDMMVPHQETVIEMSALAVIRASHVELSEYAEQLIQTQETEIARLRAQRADWYGSPDTPPNTHTPVLIEIEHGQEGVRITDLEAEVDALRQADDQFDQEFLERLIAHQEEAIRAAQVVMEQSLRPEIQYLAEKIIQERQAEIQDLQRMLDRWYGQPEQEPDESPLGVRT